MKELHRHFSCKERFSEIPLKTETTE